MRRSENRVRMKVAVILICCLVLMSLQPVGVIGQQQEGEPTKVTTVPPLSDGFISPLLTAGELNTDGYWEQTSGPPGDVYSLAIDPDNPQILYAGTYSGEVFKSSDGGASWSPSIERPTDSRVQCLVITPSNSETLYAGTRDGVFKSTNGGQSWSSSSSGFTNSAVLSLAIDPNAPQTLYAGTYSGGGVWKSSNGGASWSPSYDGLTNGEVQSLTIDPVNPQTLYGGTYGGGIFKSSNGGANWTASSTGLVNSGLINIDTRSLAIDPKNPQILYAGTYRDGVFKSTNGGGNWHCWSSFPGSLINIDVRALAIDPVNPQILYAGTSGGDIFKSSNGGQSWSSSYGLWGSAVRCLAIDPSNPQILYAGTNGGVAFKSTNGGLDWSGSTSGLTNSYVFSLVIDPSNPQILYAGTYGGGVFKSSNGGTWWSSSSGGLTNSYVYSLAIDPDNPQILYAGTYGGGVFKSSNGGENWSSFSTGLTNSYVQSLAIDPDNPLILYAGASGGGVWKYIPPPPSLTLTSPNGGESWPISSTQMITWTSTNLKGNVAVELSRDGGLTYTQTLAASSPVSAGTCNWAVTWPASTACRVKVTSLADLTLFDTSDANFSIIVITEAQWTQLPLYGGSILCLAVTPSNPQTLYAGTGGGGVFKSTNGGTSWSFSSSGLTNSYVQCLAITPSNPQTLYAGTDGGVFKSTNGGTSWSAYSSGLTNSYVQCLAITPSNPQTLYAGTGGGGVFKSGNGGVSWTASSTGLTNSNVKYLAITPSNPQILYAGTGGGGVFKSSNGGTSWAASSSGLTDINVQSLAIDPNNPQTLYTGTNSGRIFKSSNGGVSWSSSWLMSSYVQCLAITPSNPQILYAGTGGSGVFKSSNGGGSWSSSSTGLTDIDVLSLAIDPSNPQTLYSGTWVGVFKSTSGGANWAASSTGLTNTAALSLAIDPSNFWTFYAGTWGGVFKSTNGGVSWTASSTGLTNSIVYSLVVNPNNSQTLYAGTYGGGVFVSYNGGNIWNSSSGGLTNKNVQSLAIDPNNSQILYAGTNGGGVFKSGNGGNIWSSYSSGLTNSNVQSLALHPSNSQILYAGTGGGVFKSTNGGTSWSSSSAGLTNSDVRSLAIDPKSSLILYAGTYGGGVFKSSNGGASWSSFSSEMKNSFVYSLATDPFTPQTLFAGTSGGGVWKYTPRTPSITLLSPNGVESWPISSTQTITWTSSNLEGNVAITLSRDGGLTTTQTLATLSTTVGSYLWTVTGSVSATCRVKVSSTDNPSISDSSDANFTISPTGNAWLNLNPGGAPSVREMMAMCYDPDGQRTLLFGGSEGNLIPLGETWAYNSSTNTWSNLNPSSPPPGRSTPAMVYDTAHRKAILFGGYGGEPTGRMNETWAYDFSSNAWENRTPAVSPPARNWLAMAYDAEHDKTILYGGNGNATLLSDTWAYDYTSNTWTDMAPSFSPGAESGHKMIYDAHAKRVILFDGANTWAYDYGGNTWNNLLSSNSPPVCGELTYDPITDQTILFSGWNGYDLQETWVYSYSTNRWTNLNPSNPPLGRSRSGLVYDLTAKRAILFGGWNNDGTQRLGDTWALFLNNPLALDYLSLSPATATIVAGTTQPYTVFAYDTYGNSWDVTALASYAVSPDGSTLANIITATHTGSHVVSVSYGGKSATASIQVNPAVLDHFTFATISSPQTAGVPFPLSLTAYDSFNNVKTDFTGPATLSGFANSVNPTSIPFTNGVANPTLTITKAMTGVLTITSASISNDSNTFTVTHSASVDHLSLAPATATIVAGTTQTYTSTAYDAYGNSWDITALTAFSISPNGSFSGNIASVSLAGPHTITGSYATKSATALLQVTPGAPHHFTFATIPSPQTAGASFPVTLTAYDSFNNIKTDYSGPTTLSGFANSVNPTSIPFTNGVANPTLTITKAMSGFLTITSASILNNSNIFTVNHGAAVSISLTPKNQTITADQSLPTWVITACDSAGNTWDVTSSSTITVPPNATAKVVGVYTINAAYLALSDSTNLTIVPYTPVTSSLLLEPASATILVGQTHTVTAFLKDQRAMPMAGIPVTFTVTGIHPFTTTLTTNEVGVAILSYTGTQSGSDFIVASVSGGLLVSLQSACHWFLPAGGLEVHFYLQGMSPTHTITLALSFCTPGGGSVLFSQTLTGLADGNPIICPDLPIGIYDLKLKEENALSTLRQGVQILSSSTTTADFGEQQVGDANGDDVVNILDFALLKASFGKTTGQAGFDPRADFNGDGTINASDFALMKSNFGRWGPL